MDDDERVPLTPEQLTKLGRSREIREHLKDENLRQIIRDIESPTRTQTEKEALLMEAMKEPEFADLLEEILATVGHS